MRMALNKKNTAFIFCQSTNKYNFLVVLFELKIKFFSIRNIHPYRDMGHFGWRYTKLYGSLMDSL